MRHLWALLLLGCCSPESLCPDDYQAITIYDEIEGDELTFCQPCMGCEDFIEIVGYREGVLYAEQD